jgi:protein tyrosine/serine phosphatase
MLSLQIDAKGNWNRKRAMLGKMFNSIHKAENRLSRSFGRDISTPWTRFTAWVHFQFFDHAFLRVWWWNLEEIAPGVWRSNQPSPKRLRRYAKMGIKTVINLRGVGAGSPYLFETEATTALGMTQIDHSLSAKSLFPKETYLGLLDSFDTAERPLVMHCKSGADRAGLASALWLLHKENAPIEIAQKQLSLRYMHLKNDKTGILDDMLIAYAKDIAVQPQSIKDWLATRYDPAAITKAFAEKRRRR